MSYIALVTLIKPEGNSPPLTKSSVSFPGETDVCAAEVYKKKEEAPESVSCNIHVAREGNIKKTWQTRAEGVKAYLKTVWVAFKDQVILQG